MVELVASMDSKKLHKTIFNFDLMLWTKLLTLLKKQPKNLERFRLSQEVAQLLTNNPEKINQLASGVLISFKINYNDSNFLKNISYSIDNKFLIDGYCNYLDIAYWKLLRKLAVIDIKMSSLVFSVPYRLAEWSVSASDETLCCLANGTTSDIYLRYPSKFIHDILTKNNDESIYLKKMMFSLKSNKLEIG